MFAWYRGRQVANISTKKVDATTPKDKNYLKKTRT
jgi:hypothetical protein